VSEPPAPNSSRYLPPVRTSMSHDTSEMPVADFGTHQRWNSSGWLPARISVLCRLSTARERLASALQHAPEGVRYSEHMNPPGRAAHVRPRLPQGPRVGLQVRRVPYPRLSHLRGAA
jgi:hypothetical protein